jgi:hypothetical protein
LDAILAQGYFRVHTLTGNDWGKYTAHAFIRLQPPEAFRDLEATGVPISRTGNDAVPAIWGPGIMASLLCKALPDKMIEVGDHKVIIAEVLDMSTQDDSCSNTLVDPQSDIHDSESVTNFGLLYVQQRYGSPDTSSMAIPRVEKRSGGH